MDTCCLLPDELYLALRSDWVSVLDMKVTVCARQALPAGHVIRLDDGTVRLDKLQVYTSITKQHIRYSAGCVDQLLPVSGSIVRHCNWLRFVAIVTPPSDITTVTTTRHYTTDHVSTMRNSINIVAVRIGKEIVYMVTKGIPKDGELQMLCTDLTYDVMPDKQTLENDAKAFLESERFRSRRYDNRTYVDPILIYGARPVSAMYPVVHQLSSAGRPLSAAVCTVSTAKNPLSSLHASPPSGVDNTIPSTAPWLSVARYPTLFVSKQLASDTIQRAMQNDVERAEDISGASMSSASDVSSDNSEGEEPRKTEDHEADEYISVDEDDSVLSCSLPHHNSVDTGSPVTPSHSACQQKLPYKRWQIPESTSSSHSGAKNLVTNITTLGTEDPHHRNSFLNNTRDIETCFSTRHPSNYYSSNLWGGTTSKSSSSSSVSSTPPSTPTKPSDASNSAASPLTTTSKLTTPVKKASLTGSSKVLTRRIRSRTWLPCEMCGKKFDRPSLLRRHIRTHTGEKPHSCDVCSKAFSTSSSLNTHRRIHTGDKPHVCAICGKRFTASSNLYYHRMTHNKEKPHKCTLCSKSFPTPGDLKSHTYIHNGSWPYKCKICNRGFSKQTNLNNHLLLHTGSKPHACSLCNKRFALLCNLKTHIKTHQGSTTLAVCSLCGMKMSTSPSFNKGVAPQLCTSCVRHTAAYKHSRNPATSYQASHSQSVFPVTSYGGSLSGAYTYVTTPYTLGSYTSPVKSPRGYDMPHPPASYDRLSAFAAIKPSSLSGVCGRGNPLVAPVYSPFLGPHLTQRI